MCIPLVRICITVWSFLIDVTQMIAHHHCSEVCQHRSLLYRGVLRMIRIEARRKDRMARLTREG